jgi:hypothetical protein
MRCSMGPGRELPPLDDIGVVWKDLAACCKTVGSAERRMGTKNWHEKSTHRSIVSAGSYSGILGSLKAS